jgi:Sec-independent protein translocase protein TatA
MADDNRTQQVSLGIGTLILIALIVMIFGGGSGDLTREVQGLRSEVGNLRKAVEAQSTEIRQLRDRLPPTDQSEGDVGK